MKLFDPKLTNETEQQALATWSGAVTERAEALRSHEETRAMLTKYSEELYELYRELRQKGELFAGRCVYDAMENLDSAIAELGGKVIPGELAPTEALEEKG